MAKMYFLKGSENFCYGLDHWKDYMAEKKLPELELFEAERETGTGYFFCKEFKEVGTVGEGCGKFCDKYKPNNGKNGRCKHYGYCYDITDIKLVLHNNTQQQPALSET
jgi:hypothetical protein